MGHQNTAAQVGHNKFSPQNMASSPNSHRGAVPLVYAPGVNRCLTTEYQISAAMPGWAASERAENEFSSL
jgi:hypothetical protein